MKRGETKREGVYCNGDKVPALAAFPLSAYKKPIYASGQENLSKDGGKTWAEGRSIC